MVLGVLVLLFGLLAKTGPVSHLDLRVHRHIAIHDRACADHAGQGRQHNRHTGTVGVGLMIVIPLVLVLASRRLDALKVLCMFGGALILAEMGKKSLTSAGRRRRYGQ